MVPLGRITPCASEVEILFTKVWIRRQRQQSVCRPADVHSLIVGDLRTNRARYLEDFYLVVQNPFAPLRLCRIQEIDFVRKVSRAMRAWLSSECASTGVFLCEELEVCGSVAVVCDVHEPVPLLFSQDVLFVKHLVEAGQVVPPLRRLAIHNVSITLSAASLIWQPKHIIKAAHIQLNAINQNFVQI